MTYTFRIQRFIPEKDKKPHYEEYKVELEKTDRVLDGLNEIKWRQDGTLTFRRSCAHGVCGSDAMRINGVTSLPCKVLRPALRPKKSGKQLTITIEPIRGLPVEKDLVVDMEPFFDAYR